MKPIVQFLGCIIFLLADFEVCAQKNSSMPYLRWLTTEQGLSYDLVSSVVKDRDGFIWIGTNSGLNRYDGHRVKYYFHSEEDSSSLIANFIHSLMLDSKGRLWVCTLYGVSRYEKSSDHFVNYRFYNEKTNSESAVKNIFEDSHHHYWICTTDGLYLMDSLMHQLFFFQHHDKDSTSISSNLTETVVQDPAGRIWIGTLNGLNFYDDKNHSFGHIHITAINKWGSEITITKVYIYENNLWVATVQSGLIRIDLKTYQWKKFLLSTNENPQTYFAISDICEDNTEAHTLWVASPYQGWFKFNTLSQEFIRVEMKEPHDPSRDVTEIHSLFTDDQSNLWIGTKSGLALFSPAMQRFPEILIPFSETTCDISTRVIYQDPLYSEGNILWVANECSLFQLNTTTNQWKKISVPKETDQRFQVINAVHRDKNGTFWLATLKGLFRYDTVNKRFLRFDNDELMGMSVYEIIEGKCLYFVARRNVYAYDASKNSVSALIRDEKDYHFANAALDANDNLWLIDFFRLIRIDSRDHSVQEYIPKLQRQPTHKRAVNDVICDETNQIWLASQEGVLLLSASDPGLIEKSWTRNSTGEPVNFIYSLVEGKNKMIWCAMLNGLAGIDPYTGNVQTFTTAEGLPFNDLNYAFDIGFTGQIFIGTQNGFVEFDPATQQRVRTPASVTVSGIEIMNHPILPSRYNNNKLFLTYKDKTLRIDFSALNFPDPEQTRYQCRLDGFDERYVEYGNKSSAVYTNLPAGDFTFRVRAAIAGGEWNENALMLNIHVSPPFWRTWWFYLLCSVLICGLLYLAYRIRVQRLLALERMRTHISRDLHDDLGSTLSSISIMSQLAKQNSPQAAALLEKIGNDAQQTQENMSDIVWAINPSNDRLDNVIRRMKLFATELLEAKNIEPVFSTPEQIESAKLSMQQRRNLYLIFKEAVTNAAKYSSCTKVEMNVGIRNKLVEMTIRDNGKGIDEYRETTGGNGLLNMRKRAEELNGILKIETDKNSGTTIVLQFRIT